MDRIRTVVVDDHPLFRDGVVLTLAKDPGFEVVGSGASGAHALQLAKTHLPDILLLDINLPGGGLETIGLVREASPATRVIMLTASDREEHVTAALEAGAVGYVLKGSSAAELIRAVHATIDGETYVTPTLVARLLARTRRASEPARPSPVQSGLTQREEQILDCVAAGQTNKEIARRLDLSEKTVKHYMTNIMQKLQVRNRVEAALMAKRRATRTAS